ncbi:hypothetical protein C8R43DRAFT_952674 [Mycena crocata]|nr:hypothetical protein C8R43DRAFT_952674 [Mycena crocata]
MLLKPFIFLGFLGFTTAADILTFKIIDYQGMALDLTDGRNTTLNPVQSAASTKDKSQNWLFIYAAHGDQNEYRVVNAAGSTVLSYTTATVAGPTTALHAQIAGNQNVDTNWDVLPLASKFNSFIEKSTGLAITSWPAGTGSNAPLTLEVYDKRNTHQMFKLVQPPSYSKKEGLMTVDPVLSA